MKIKSFFKAASLTAAMLSSFTLLAEAELALDFNVESGTEQITATVGDEAVMKNDASAKFTLELPESFMEKAFPDGQKPSSFTFRPAEDKSDSASLFSVYFVGDGTEESPYLISNADDLDRFSSLINSDFRGEYVGAHYALTDDIDLGGIDWVPAGYYSDETKYLYTFQGVFDGQGHSISNFVIKSNTAYAGLFGLIYNGSVKNLTVSNARIQIKTSSAIYAGALAGRVLALNGNQTVIENCHAENAEINIESTQYSVYAGGLVGYLHASLGASIKLSGCSSKADLIGYQSDSYVSPGKDTRFNVTLGGLAGYVGATGENSTIDISTSYSLSHINGKSDVLRSASAGGNDNVKAGGLLGYFGSEKDAVITLRNCYASGGVLAESRSDSFAGGLLGYLIAASSASTVENCYANANVYASSSVRTAYLGGFTSIAGVLDSTDLVIHNCYAAGNVIGFESNITEGGKFTSYALEQTSASQTVNSKIKFSGCFTLKDSLLYCNKPYTPETEIDHELSAESAGDLSSYIGFSDTDWKTGEDSYPYPVLTATSHRLPKITVVFLSGSETFRKLTGNTYGTSVSAPDKTPDSHYIFSHWSLMPDSDAVTPSDIRLTGDTLFFANFTDEYRSYTISFSADGVIIKTEELPYGSAITFPAAPEKAPDQAFRYTFSHWSDTENGADNCKNATVSGDTTYYAVYTRTETGVWDGTTSVPFDSGDGTENSPYQVKTASNLYFLSQNINSDEYRKSFYVLARDIDLGGNEWLPIGNEEYPFSGNFNGAGYTISNFKITSPAPYVGVFGLLQNATVSKLAVSDFVIDVTLAKESATLYAGAVAGKLTTGGINALSEISECSSTGTIKVSSASVQSAFTYVGGIVGEAATPTADDTMLIYLENCYSLANISVDTPSLSMVGGITGHFRAATLGIAGIDRCYFAGEILAKSNVSAYAGGIVGFLADSSAYIETSLSEAVLYAAAEKGTVRNCFATGDVKAETSKASCYAGHIYGNGNAEATMANCVAYKNMKVVGSKVPKFTALVDSLETFYDPAYLAELGFDVDTVWTTDGKALPILSYENLSKNVFRIKTFSYDAESRTLTVSLLLSFRDTESYTVLAGAYNNRGKMIDLVAHKTENAATLQTVDLELDALDDAETFTVSVVDSATLALLESPLELRV